MSKNDLPVSFFVSDEAVSAPHEAKNGLAGALNAVRKAIRGVSESVYELSKRIHGL